MTTSLLTVRDIIPVKVQDLVRIEEIEKIVETQQIQDGSSLPSIITHLMTVFAKAKMEKLDKKDVVTNILLFLIEQSDRLTTGTKFDLCSLVPVLIDTFAYLAKNRSKFKAGFQFLNCCS
jgi:transaldolase